MWHHCNTPDFAAVHSSYDPCRSYYLILTYPFLVNFNTVQDCSQLLAHLNGMLLAQVLFLSATTWFFLIPYGQIGFMTFINHILHGHI
jgi:hypothetical protein